MEHPIHYPPHMETVPTIVDAVLTVFSVVAIGFFVRRLGWLSEEADQTMLKLVIRVLLPCLILDSVIGNEQLRDPVNLVGPPLAAFVMVGFGSVFALWISRLRITGIGDDVERRTFAFAVGLQNYGYIPMPLVKMLFDDGTFGVLLVYAMGVELSVWTLGVSLLPGDPSKPVRPWYTRAINAPAIAIVIAVILNFLDAESWLFHQTSEMITLENDETTRHETDGIFVTKVIVMLGQCAVPLGILLVGATVADYLGQTRFRACWRPVSMACLIRLVFLPGLFIVGAAFTPGMSDELRHVLIVQAAMPAAVYPIILSRLFGGDPATAVRVAMSTSIVGLLTIPAWIALGLWLIGST